VVGRVIFIGDVHGCLDELDDLVRTLSLSSSDRVVMIGDLIDRGPDPVGVVRRVRESGWDCVLGNHEEKAIHWLKNESMVKGGRPNNMQPPSPVRMAEWRRLSPKDVGWLWKLPLTIQARGWTAVHAGFEPRFDVAGQKADRMLRVRFCHKDTGKYVPMDPEKMEQPPDTLFWAEMWRGPESVVYGHSVFEAVRFDSHPEGAMCVGIDTGCVYGGSLTAAVVDSGVMELVSVKAKKEYFSYKDRAKQ
jgi:diadenosine tetraphosphatase ApaH/serine/threonine PP2A family protein phosphatase